MDREELGVWLRLLETEQIGRESARRLLAAFASPQALFDAPASAHREVVGATKAAALATCPQTLEPLLTATLQWLDAGPSRSIITLGDPGYPPQLLDSADPPLLLYAEGRRDLLRSDAIAIVGSRNPTPQGRDNARDFARHLSDAGFTIVSGLALGIDGAAHAGGLEGAAGTIAVVGTGLDRVYPRGHLRLAHQIAEHGGLMLGEFPIGVPPLASNFPLRNRIIAGLARGTLVVEAAVQSGSLITARVANEAGRDVFAIPGSIHSPQSRGCHALIKQGAKLVETAQDILEELRGVVRVSAGTSRSDDAPASSGEPLLDALGFDPVTLDALVARTGRSPAEISVRLLELELDGAVARLPGQLFQRVSRG